MNALLYNFIQHRKINGTLFYCFEYFCFLRDNGYDIKYIIVDISDKDLEYVKEVFKDKYNFNHEYLNHFIPINKKYDLYKLNIQNLITLDTRSIEINRPFLPRTNIFAYAGSGNTSKVPIDFYGWYDYQKPWKYKTRLKLYKDIHKTYEKVDNKIFFSSYTKNYLDVQDEIGYDYDDILEKNVDKAVDNLFSKITKAVYYGTTLDANNRLVPECYIHGVEFEGYNLYPDSVKERHELIQSGKADELFLTMDDLLIRNYIENIKC